MTKKHIDSGKLVVIGVVQEQHPKRTALYAQWKKLDWPIAYDPLNQLKITAVPMSLMVDENGNVVSKRLRKGSLEKWLESPAPASQPMANKQKEKDDDNLSQIDIFLFGSHWKSVSKEAYWSDQEPLVDQAIRGYQKILTNQPNRSEVHFRLGVAFRIRYDRSKTKSISDFQAAVNHWTRALELNPNHYIFRRRIQQYGPRLGKPYPFYDWVDAANKEITARGEVPIKLTSRLTESEIAKPLRSQSSQKQTPPDPESKISSVDDTWLEVEHVLVPSKLIPGKPARIHLKLSLDTDKVSWNDQAGPALAWMTVPAGFSVIHPRKEIPPFDSERNDPKEVEFEIRVPKSYKNKPVRVSGYLLLHLCQKEDGVCVYRRKEFSFLIPRESN